MLVFVQPYKPPVPCACRDQGQEDRPLTRELAEVLLQVAEQLSKGKAVLVAPCDTRLTTQDAADILGISIA